MYYFIQYLMQFRQNIKTVEEIVQITQLFKNKYVFVAFEYDQQLTLCVSSKIAFNPSMVKKEQTFFDVKKMQKNENNSFLNLCKYLLPQISGEGIPSLDIAILDTIFYSADGTLQYFFTDRKKGLTRYKNKNVCQFFLKRKSQVNDIKRFYTNNFSREASQHKSYIALLKYKDQSIIRLNEYEFKGIFYNPLYSHEKFKNINNTEYIQLLHTEDSIYNIQFFYEKFKTQQLFQIAVKNVCRESSSFFQKKQSQVIKNIIKTNSIEVYLYYLTFEIFAYISIHHHKKLDHAIFTFVKSPTNYSISSVQQICFLSHQNKQFYRTNLLPIQQIVSLEECLRKQSVFGQDINDTTLLQKTVQGYFSQQNTTIQNNISEFVGDRFQKIRNPKDIELSNVIFKTLNPGVKEDLHTMLNNQAKLKNWISKDNKHQIKIAQNNKQSNKQKLGKYHLINQHHFS